MSLQPFKPSGFTALLGIELGNMENGSAELRVPIKPELLNSAATVHGGALASLVDCVAGAAAFSVVPRDRFSITTDLHTTYLKSVGKGELQCFATVIHQSRSKLAVEASIRQGDILVAQALVSYMIVERRKPLEGLAED